MLQRCDLSRLFPPDVAASAVPAVLSAALRREPHPAQEHRHLCGGLQQGQGARSHPEALPGQDPGLQRQEQVSQF